AGAIVVMSADAKLCMIIGDPVAHSLSPAIHNAAYKALGLGGRFRYEARQVKPDQLADFMNEVRDKDIRGVSCTAPHKVAIMGHMDDIDPVAARIGAVNTVVNDKGRLKGYNTDWLGIMRSLEKITPLKGKRVALLGAGGAARSIAYGLVEKGAKVTVYNRTVEKARALAEEFGADSAGLDEVAAVKQADIIVNATSAGMSPNDGATPLPEEYISGGQIVFDSIYVPYETRLLKEAAARGARVIHGTEMLLAQAVEQFRLYTGYDAPEDVMRRALEEALGI
ncbi:MAG TPA: shikimate dehydrogenase, partial [Candidatus Saccharimonadales bacterium]|nr:shikimate dehydrogenase [Candidatus Saccharimonadales bacterium]